MLFMSKILQKRSSGYLVNGASLCELCPEEKAANRPQWHTEDPGTFIVFDPRAFKADYGFFEAARDIAGQKGRDRQWKFWDDAVAFTYPLCDFPHPPRVANLRSCHPVFMDILNKMKPKLVVVVGKDTAKSLLGHGVSPPDIRTLAGQFILPDDFAVDGYLTPFMVIRSPSFMAEFGDDVAAEELFEDHLKRTEELWKTLPMKVRHRPR